MQARTALAAATAAAALGLPAVAQAHVTVNPREVLAGSFQVLGVRVPNERDDSSTVKVVLRLPHGFAFLSYEPQPGWRVRLVQRRLRRPLEVFGQPVRREYAKVVFTGSRRGLGKIRPGQFREFRLSALVPGAAGDVLAFKTVQRYDTGEVVRWTGTPGSDAPAPRVTLTEAAAAHGSAVAAEPRGRAAHAAVLRRSPAPGSTVGRVRGVSVQLAQGVLGGRIVVRRDGRRLAPKASGVNPRDRSVIRAAFRRPLASGGYRVSWGALSADGHRQRGAWRFRVR